MTLQNLNNFSKDELITAKRANKDELLATKKAATKFTDSLVSQPFVSEADFEKKSVANPEDSNTLDVTVVANTTNFMDSHSDVILTGAYDESIATRGNSIPHIADHKHEATSHVGDVQKVYTKNIPLRSFGLEQEGETQALLFDTTIRKDYNENIFNFYKSGKINQHSIGLTYGDIQLAINSQHEDDKAEYEVWQKYYPSIINKDLADKKGYFWAVPKVDVRENSAVLFGSNPLTPTLNISKNEPFFKNNPSFTNKGVTMTLEEKLQKAEEELAALKSSQASSTASATKAEQERILGIQKAAETYGIEGDITKYITKGYTVEQVEDMFGMIGEKKQKENPSPKQEPQSGQEGKKSEDSIPTDPADQLVFGFKHLTDMNDVFKGFK